jgi:hypothetical protein
MPKTSPGSNTTPAQRPDVIPRTLIWQSVTIVIAADEYVSAEPAGRNSAHALPRIVVLQRLRRRHAVEAGLNAFAVTFGDRFPGTGTC